MNVRTRLRREPEAVKSARAFIRHQLRGAGAPHDVIANVELAAAEACNNVILHSGSRTFTVQVGVEDGTAVIVVADAGNGFDPPRHPTMPEPESEGHRGLALMQELVDTVDVISTDRGTTVLLTEPLEQSAVRA
jgi:anti-sigma regulatory factor (Ser/Thr protein kinase)